jgi:hypothetical protein
MGGKQYANKKQRQSHSAQKRQERDWGGRIGHTEKNLVGLNLKNLEWKQKEFDAVRQGKRIRTESGRPRTSS